MTFFLQYRLHVALLAFLLTLAPFPAPYTADAILISLACALLVVFVYVFNKTTDAVEDDINSPAAPLPVKQQKRLRAVAAASLLLPALWMWQWPEVFALYVLVGAVLGFLYSYPLRLWLKKPLRLKNVLVIKNVVPSLCISLCTTLPAPLAAGHLPGFAAYVQLLAVFTVVFCIEVIWDIRDMKGDKKAGVATLPNVMGVDGAKGLAGGLFACYCFWLNVNVLEEASVPLLVSQVATMAVILLVKPGRPYWFFHLPVLIWLALYALLVGGKMIY